MGDLVLLAVVNISLYIALKSIRLNLLAGKISSPYKAFRASRVNTLRHSRPLFGTPTQLYVVSRYGRTGNMISVMILLNEVIPSRAPSVRTVFLPLVGDRMFCGFVSTSPHHFS